MISSCSIRSKGSTRIGEPEASRGWRNSSRTSCGFTYFRKIQQLIFRSVRWPLCGGGGGGVCVLLLGGYNYSTSKGPLCFILAGIGQGKANGQTKQVNTVSSFCACVQKGCLSSQVSLFANLCVSLYDIPMVSVCCRT